MPRRLKSFQKASRISFEQDESRMHTLIMLQTSDRPGLLSSIGQAFAENKLRLCNARIATAGAEARDTFAITDRENHPITDHATLEAIAASIKSRLDSD
jgi:[protein-PII] uridylyltransferase